jgi:hypothetical protein
MPFKRWSNKSGLKNSCWPLFGESTDSTWSIWRLSSTITTHSVSFVIFWNHAARSTSRESHVAFSSAEFAPWQLSRPSLKGLCELFRWKFSYSSTPSALQSWFGTFWLLAFRVHEGGTGRTTILRVHRVFSLSFTNFWAKFRRLDWNLSFTTE